MSGVRLPTSAKRLVDNFCVSVDQFGDVELMTVDKMTVDKMTVDKMTVDKKKVVRIL